MSQKTYSPHTEIEFSRNDITIIVEMDTQIPEKNHRNKELKRKVTKVPNTNAQDHLQNETNLDSPTQ